MPNTCTICRHPKQIEIDNALIAAGHLGSLRNIAKRYSVGLSSLHRHKLNCLPELKSIVQGSTAVVEAKTILRQMGELHERALKILERAEAADKLDTALRAVRECRGNLELLAQLDGTLNPKVAAAGPVNVTIVYTDKSAAAPLGSTMPQCIEGDVDDADSELVGREKGEAPPFDETRS